MDSAVSQLACSGCGAILEYAPESGEAALHCRYCGARTPIAGAPANLKSDYRELLQAALAAGEYHERGVLDCGTCGAQTRLGEGVIAERCPFCGNPSVVHATKRLLRPAAVLPFALDAQQARDALVEWERALWWKPAARLGPERGEWSPTAVYLPYWSFDWETTAQYVGQRGTKVDKETRWSRVTGTVHTKLVGSSVFGSRSVSREHGAELEPWDTDKLRAYRDEYLQGLHAETSALPLPEAGDLAQRLLERQIKYDIDCDIGGDDQRIDEKTVRYESVRVQLQLMPIWIAHFEFRGQTSRVLVNASTGEVIGDRPIARMRVWIAALAPLALAAAGAAVLPGLLDWHPRPAWRAWVTCFWGVISVLGILSFIAGSIGLARKRSRVRHKELFVSRRAPGSKGIEFDPASIWSGVLQGDPESRATLFQALGFCALFIGLFPCLSTLMFDDFVAPVLMMHGFAAVALGIFIWATRASRRDRRHLLGLDQERDPERVPLTPRASRRQAKPGGDPAN